MATNLTASPGYESSAVGLAPVDLVRLDGKMVDVTDSMGLTLGAGDPVVYQPDADGDGVMATVLKVISSNQCLIQLDRADRTGFAPGEPGEMAAQYELLLTMRHGKGDDLQDVFLVPSNALTFMGEMEWSDDDEEDEE
jgi:hypothetical protein